MRFPRRLASLAVCLLCSPIALPTFSFAGEHRFVLSSAAAGTRIESFELSDHVDQAINSRWKVSQRTLHGGMQEGVQLITIDNGQLIVEIVPTRGMSIRRVMNAATGERLFGWDSPVKEVVHPLYVDLESRGGLGWLRGFNEWMVRCGLEFAGHPGKDQFLNNTGEEAELDLTLHGKIGNIPASEVELFIEDQPPFRLRLRGAVEERMFYGPKLQLVTEMSMQPKQRSINLAESITNLGASDQEYQIIYHTNFGTPLLEAGSKVVVAAAQVTPMNDQAAKGVDAFDTYQAPTLGFIEEVYLVEPFSDSKGTTAAVLHNAAKTRGALMRWSTSHLPYLTLWKNTAATADGYVTGIEPGSGFPFNRRVERHFGRVPVLAAGQSHSFSLEFSLLEDADDVDKGIKIVEGIAAGATPTIQASPPEVPAAKE